LQAIVTGGQQLIEFAQALVQLAGGFADVGLGQAGDPALEVARGGFAERQARLRGNRSAQQRGDGLAHAKNHSSK
jgi:hypothetical protein